jgi:hypothetical protein
VSLRIGNGCGFWGDNLDAPILLAQHGELHFLTLEYLAELSMSILALQKQRDPETGYAGDFLDVLERLSPILQNKPRMKIITNAGGMNAQACARKARDILKKAGVFKRIAVVEGDDLLPQLEPLFDHDHLFTNLDTGDDLGKVFPSVVSANAYLGAAPIVEALQEGADLVITGRVADASLTVAPLMHHYPWTWDDWPRLSAASVAGHLIECGAQATGGLWCRYGDAPDLANVGYPIVDVEPDGTFIITKPPGTGGAVNVETVSEQLLYEVGDPSAYMTPDVVADFTSVRLESIGPDTVRVTTTRGSPATDTYKVSIAYRDGFSASGTLTLLGPDAQEKALACGDIIRERLRRIDMYPEHSYVEVLGTGACAPGVFALRPQPVEVVLRVTVLDSRRPVVERFTKEFAPLVTSGPPGVTGYTSGRPPVREVFAYWPALVAKSVVSPKVTLLS